MSHATHFLSPSQAARALGVSVKALRLYEARGLLAPDRTAAGWRAYGPDQMARAGRIATLRGLGLSLVRVAQALDGQAEPALAAHQAQLEARIGELAVAADKVRDLRTTPSREDVSAVAFALPWPWGGERFALARVTPLTFITGPLGSGKTRLAQRLAQALDIPFLGLDRPDDQTLEADGPQIIDSPEHGLAEAEQRAFVARLRRRDPDAAPVMLLTRSSAILDLAEVGEGETILYCPASHAPPMRVSAHVGAPGREAVALCLAAPAVRARTEGMMAVMPTC